MVVWYGSSVCAWCDTARVTAAWWQGATQVFVRTGEEAYDVMVAGKHNLQVAATGVNARSSRSHCIFTITTLAEAGAGCRVSSVRLCDLAGCERARRTRNAGARLAESRAINSSLHVLERCLRTLRQRQRARTDTIVPYRSLLTTASFLILDTLSLVLQITNHILVSFTKDEKKDNYSVALPFFLYKHI